VSCSAKIDCKVHENCETHCKFPITEQTKEFNISFHRQGLIDETLAVLRASSSGVVTNGRMTIYVVRTDDNHIYLNMAITDIRCVDAGNYRVVPSNGDPIGFQVTVKGKK